MSRYHANELLNNRTNDIQHWKYVKKIKVGSGNRYFYSWDEYKAYLADPTAELEKVGNKAKQEIKTAGKKASVQVKKTGKKSYKEIQSRGKKAVEKMSSQQTKGNVTLGVVKGKNKSRPESFKQRLDELAKKASEKWKAGKEEVKKTIQNGRDWIDKKIEDHKEKKEQKRKEKQKELDNKREQLAKKYKYLKRIKVDGRYVYFYSQDEIDNYNKQKEYQENEPSFMKNVKESKIPYTSEEDAILVNPKWDEDDWDARYEYNCAECSAIYELRRRGYDVESNGESGIGENSEKYNTEKRFDYFYENANVQKPQATYPDDPDGTYKAIKAEIDKNPPGSRGDLSVAWTEGGGHSLVWEKDSKGQIHIIDSQVSGNGNKVEYDLRGLCDHVDNSSSTGEEWGMKKGRPVTTVTRTDNLTLKKDVLNICEESEDRKRKPNASKKLVIDYVKKEVRYETMSEEELVKKYYNLLYKGA